MFVSGFLTLQKFPDANISYFFYANFGILTLYIWWRFVVMFPRKQNVPNDQANQWFPLLIKFHLIDERLECLLILLFMYVYYLLPQNRI